jgi:putative ABC transport system ATP-binding protein
VDHEIENRVETSASQPAGPCGAVLASVLELTGRSLGQPVPPARALLALDLPSEAQSWVEAMIGGAMTIGMRANAVEGRPAQIMDELGPATVAVTRASDKRWLLLRAIGGKRARVEVVDESGTRRARKLSVAAVTRLSGDGCTSWVLVEPWLPLTGISASTDPEFPRRPWSRLRAFLRLERRDLWGVALYAVVVGVLTLATPVAVQVLVNTIAFGAVMQPLAVLLIMLMGVLTLSASLRVVETYVLEVIQRRVFVRTAEDFGRRLPTVTWDTHRKYDVAELVNRFFDVPNVQKSLTALYLDGLTLALQTLAGMILLAFYHPFLLAFDLVLIAMLVVVFLMGRGAVDTARAESKAKYATAAWLQNVARAPSIFRGQRRLEYVARETAALCRDWLHARRDHFRVVLRQVIGGMVLYATITVALLGVGGWLVLDGQLTLGQLIAAELVVANLAYDFTKLGKHMETSYDLVVGVEKLAKVIDLPSERQGGLLLDETRPVRLEARGMKIGPGSDRSGIDLVLTPRDRLQLVGAVASGKTTLLETLAGLRQPSSGNILVNGTDLDRISLPCWRDAAHLVRGMDIIEGTVLENLQLGPQRVEEPEARAVAHLLDLEDAIDRLPGRFEAALHASGAPLSETQIRRLVLARALLAHPRVLMLDRALDGLGLEASRLEELLEYVLGSSAPWAAVVVTDDPRVAKWCGSQLRLGEAA